LDIQESAGYPDLVSSLQIFSGNDYLRLEGLSGLDGGLVIYVLVCCSSIIEKNSFMRTRGTNSSAETLPNLEVSVAGIASDSQAVVSSCVRFVKGKTATTFLSVALATESVSRKNSNSNRFTGLSS